MKNVFRKLTVVALLAGAISVQAQQVTTLYFLENAPMRHLVNPAFQPVSNGYINFTPLGYTSLWVGNNSLTMSDLVYIDPLTGKTITALHPNGDKAALLRSFRKATLVDGGIGNLAVQYGYYRYETGIMIFTIVVLVFIVQLAQYIGDYVAKKLTH